MPTIKASVLHHKRTFEVTLDKESNRLLGDAFVYSGPTEAYALDVLRKHMKERGVVADIEVVERAGSGCSAQESAYLDYRAKGGDLPLSIYLEG